MLNHSDIMSTVDMIDHQHLDIRTITMGISLLDCADPNPEACARKVHDKICRQAEHLVATGCQIERELGIPIVNKRISVTPIALVASACETEDFVPFAKAMDSAAKTCGVDFIGGFSALVQKGMASGDRRPSRRRWPRRSWSAPASTSPRQRRASTWTLCALWGRRSKRRPS